MNILIVTPQPVDTTSWYRAWGVFPELVKLGKKLGVDINLFSDKGKQFAWNDINQMDLIYMHRPYTLAHLKFAVYCKDMNKKIWMDYDDDLTSIPEWMPFYETFMNQDTLNVVWKLISLADVLTVSTKALGERLRKESYVVVPNAYNDYLLSPDCKYSESNTVMWRGSDTHFMDLFSFTPQIREQYESFKEQWVWTYFGYNPWFLPKHHHIPVMDPVMYYKKIRELAPNVMFVPLVNNGFNQCKSNINWIEATMAGAVCLVPKWESWDTPGSYKYTDAESFNQGLYFLLSDDYEKKAAWEESMNYIVDNLLLSSVNNSRLNILDKLRLT